MDDWHSQVPRREGESLEHYEARIRFLRRVSDWSDPESIQVIRKPVEPLAELQRRIFRLAWNRPKR
jgi:hypothetical protein